MKEKKYRFGLEYVSHITHKNRWLYKCYHYSLSPTFYFLSQRISLQKYKNYWKIQYIKKLKDLKVKKTKTWSPIVDHHIPCKAKLGGHDPSKNSRSSTLSYKTIAQVQFKIFQIHSLVFPRQNWMSEESTIKTNKTDKIKNKKIKQKNYSAATCFQRDS